MAKSGTKPLRIIHRSACSPYPACIYTAGRRGGRVKGLVKVRTGWKSIINPRRSAIKTAEATSSDLCVTIRVLSFRKRRSLGKRDGGKIRDITPAMTAARVGCKNNNPALKSERRRAPGYKTPPLSYIVQVIITQPHTRLCTNTRSTLKPFPRRVLVLLIRQVDRKVRGSWEFFFPGHRILLSTCAERNRKKIPR